MDDRKSLAAYGIVVLVLVGGFYAVILSPYTLREGTELAIVGFIGAALQWAFGNAVASATARSTSNATDAATRAVMQTPPTSPPAASGNGGDGTTVVG